MCVVLIWFDGKNLYIILIIYRLNQAGPYRLQNNQNSSLNAHDLQLDCLSSDTEEEEDVTVVKICRRRKDGNLLKRLPDCPTDQNPNPNLELCDDIDPSRLLLEHVSKLFHGNYSCEAANEAGWSERSEPQELEIYCEYF